MSTVQQVNNRNAVWSCIGGVVAWFTGPIGLIFAIAAIITGNKGKREIRESPETFKNPILATIGIVLGWITLVLWSLVLVLALTIISR